jgi:hypothetical protein
MITKIYFDYYTECEIIVEEMERKEAISYTTDFIDGIELSKVGGWSTEMSIYVEYKDGSHYLNIDGDEYGKFKKINIKGIILDDGYCYYVFGNYKMSENTIPVII